MILAIDPGNTESAYVVVDNELRPFMFGKVENESLNNDLPLLINQCKVKQAAVEMVASYGMAVGKEVFETCVWIGRFTETLKRHTDIEEVKPIFRKDEKVHLCGSMRAKDANIRQALIDRFGVVGTKKNPGWFYGFKGDIWAAYAVAVTYAETIREAG